ncbi:hypothetical protein Tcan_08235 [Toxocara canis]|uniref:SAM domain-containing protein n=1 Tax=Toxocara canis TaxID=6265 RepID=A0A0B2VDE7_TOXCA|nr:hypothetical protein Tcan_08235 [Toxocara canis]
MDDVKNFPVHGNTEEMCPGNLEVDIELSEGQSRNSFYPNEGRILVEITEDQLLEIGVSDFEDRQDLLLEIRKQKLFSDLDEVVKLSTSSFTMSTTLRFCRQLPPSTLVNPPSELWKAFFCGTEASYEQHKLRMNKVGKTKADAGYEARLLQYTLKSEHIKDIYD